MADDDAEDADAYADDDKDEDEDDDDDGAPFMGYFLKMGGNLIVLVVCVIGQSNFKYL